VPPSIALLHVRPDDDFYCSSVATVSSIRRERVLSERTRFKFLDAILSPRHMYTYTCREMSLRGKRRKASTEKFQRNVL